MIINLEAIYPWEKATDLAPAPLGPMGPTGPMRTHGAHGTHGDPWGPWGPWGPMGPMGTHGAHGARGAHGTRGDPWGPMGARPWSSPGLPWALGASILGPRPPELEFLGPGGALGKKFDFSKNWAKNAFNKKIEKSAYSIILSHK